MIERNIDWTNDWTKYWMNDWTNVGEKNQVFRKEFNRKSNLRPRTTEERQLFETESNLISLNEASKQDLWNTWPAESNS